MAALSAERLADDLPRRAEYLALCQSAESDFQHVLDQPLPQRLVVLH